MAGVGLLHGVHRQRANRVDAQLVKFAIVSWGVGGHRRCTHNLLISLLRNSLKKFWKEPYSPAIEAADSVSLKASSPESFFDKFFPRPSALPKAACSARFQDVARALVYSTSL